MVKSQVVGQVVKLLRKKTEPPSSCWPVKEKTQEHLNLASTKHFSLASKCIHYMKYTTRSETSIPKRLLLWNSRRLKTVISQISSQGVPMFRFPAYLERIHVATNQSGNEPNYMLRNQYQFHKSPLPEFSQNHRYGMERTFPSLKNIPETGWPSGLGREDQSKASCEPMLCRSLGTPARQPGCWEWERFGNGKMAMKGQRLDHRTWVFSSNQRKINGHSKFKHTWYDWWSIDWSKHSFLDMNKTRHHGSSHQQPSELHEVPSWESGVWDRNARPKNQTPSHNEYADHIDSMMIIV